MRIPRGLRDLQARWESRCYDFSISRLFHGLDLLFSERRQELSLRAVVSDTVSSDGEGKCCVQVLMDDHLASGHGAAPFGRFDLHDQVVKAHGVSRSTVRRNRWVKTISRFLCRQVVPMFYCFTSSVSWKIGRAHV